MPLATFVDVAFTGVAFTGGVSMDFFMMIAVEGCSQGVVYVSSPMKSSESMTKAGNISWT